MSPRLVIKDVDGKRVFPLGDAVTTIGRTAGNSIPIKENASSRTHCQVSRKPDGWYVQDMGSRNGTQVNKQTVAEHRLADGDVIQIGKTRLVFLTGASTASEPALRAVGAAGAAAPAEDGPVTERYDRSRLDDDVPGDGALPGVTEKHALVHFAGAEERAYPISRAITSLGRADANDIAIKGSDATSCSGKHAELRLEDGRFVLHDLGSTNGTKVNGIAIEKHVLKPGDIVELGRAQFLFRSESMGAGALDELRRAADAAPAASPRGAGGRGVVAFLLPFALTLGGFVGAVGGLAWFAASQTFQPPPVVEPIPGNLIEEHSFEDVSSGDRPAGWSASGDGAVAIEVAGAPSGRRALALTQADAGSGPAPWLAVRYDRTLEVRPGQGYRLAAQLRHAKGAGRIAMRMRWLNGKDAEYQRDEFSRLLPAAPDWVKVAESFAVPDGADRLEVACVAVGAVDQALFDGIVLRPSDTGAEPAPTLDSAECRIVLDRAGQASAWIGRNELVLGGLRVIVLSDSGQVMYDQPHLELAAPPVARDGVLAYAGSLPSLRGGESLPLQVSIRRAADGFSLSFAVARGPRGGSLHLRASTGRLDADGPILVESQRELKSLRGAFVRPEVTLVRWAGRSRPIGLYPETPSYVRYGTEPPGIELFTPMAESGETTLAVKLRLNFSQDKAAMKAAFEAAAAARKADRPGEAHRLLREVQRAFPFLDGSAEAAPQLAQLERDADVELARLQADLERARFFDRVRLFEDVQRAIDRFTQRHAGFAQATERAGEIATRLADAYGTASVAEREEQAARLLRQAADFAEVGWSGLAAASYRRLLVLYPQSTQADAARTALAALGKDK